ncbi:MAG TPA: transglutaminase domain-containing protein [Thermoleophilaceae bacterium]|nr:transglutaminase domain-containing protein [Thermoleophilaceae bacterium]
MSVTTPSERRLARPAAPQAPATNGAPARDAAPPPLATRERDSEAVRLAAFAALALFGALHWARLVVDPPEWRLLLLVALSVAGGAGLLALRRVQPPGIRFAAAAATALGLLCVSLVVAGLNARLLAPGNWGELIDGLDRGLSGIQAVGWPYDGPDPWVRLTTLLGPPLLLALAAAFAFWPARRGAGVLRAAGLVLLLVLYGTAVTEYDPGQPVLRGLVLLVLVAAWLWLPRLGPREAARGTAAVLAVGILALPLSGRLDGDRPWWDYRAWDWFGAGESVTFDWTHSYGPLDWPRDGETVLNVRAERPHYWKAETLDSFDGFRWLRSERNDTARTGSEVPGRRSQDRRWDYFEYNPNWEESIRFTVRSLTSSFVVGAGVTLSVDGVDAVPTADGTAEIFNDVLEQGDSYTVRAYVPQPTPAQLAGAPEGFSGDLLQYTQIQLPGPSESALGGDNFGEEEQVALRETVYLPLWGEPPGTASLLAEQEVLDSDYARIYRLARRITDGAANPYEAVRRVERHLQDNYRYSERVPSHDIPLAGFLFEDRAGYCQQFSGAMALMLRMAGIPARVASGFTRGSYNRDTGEWRVRDLDAHSWVEVYFTGVGWVNFDPTPSAAPAEGQTTGLDPNDPGAGAVFGSQGGEQGGASERGGQPQPTGAGGDGPSWWLLALLLAAAGAAALVVTGLRASRARRTLSPERVAQAQIDELSRALARLGWAIPGGTTLLALERRLGRVAGPASARYAARLRAHRYDPTSPRPPGLRARRELRRELGARGLRSRVLALIAIPPGGPRVREGGF